ncbi:translation initiation factor IF-2-like [Cervus canadensis]|uniref:translation initiation factor IF-2-like n=1 Tax=Cervus canadensis TaxID=1574408 RepID=UPI001C9E70A5|nr:translation initiation factor IF-2-like [Cervus canadensis]
MSLDTQSLCMIRSGHNERTPPGRRLGAGACRWGFSKAGFPRLPLELPEGHGPATLDTRPSPSSSCIRSSRASALPARFPETPRFPCRRRVCKKPKPRPRPPRQPGAGNWGLRPGLGLNWAAGAAPPGPTEPRWRWEALLSARAALGAHPLQVSSPAAQHRPRESCSSNPIVQVASDGGVPSEGGGQPRQLPCNNVEEAGQPRAGRSPQLTPSLGRAGMWKLAGRARAPSPPKTHPSQTPGSVNLGHLGRGAPDQDSITQDEVGVLLPPARPRSLPGALAVVQDPLAGVGWE